MWRLHELRSLGNNTCSPLDPPTVLLLRQATALSKKRILCSDTEE